MPSIVVIYNPIHGMYQAHLHTNFISINSIRFFFIYIHCFNLVLLSMSFSLFTFLFLLYLVQFLDFGPPRIFVRSMVNYVLSIGFWFQYPNYCFFFHSLLIVFAATYIFAVFFIFHFAVKSSGFIKFSPISAHISNAHKSENEKERLRKKTPNIYHNTKNLKLALHLPHEIHSNTLANIQNE